MSKKIFHLFHGAIMTTLRLIVFVIALCSPLLSVARTTAVHMPDSTQNAGGGDTLTFNDTNAIATKIYMNVSSSMRTNTRTVGIPEQFGARFGNEPVAGVGLGLVYWGDLLFNTNKLRTALTLGKSVNVYPSPKFLTSTYLECQIGYAVAEFSAFKIYPYLGYAFSDMLLDQNARLSVISGEIGCGADYFLPKTPLIVTLHAGYKHYFNREAAIGATNNQAGMCLRGGVSLFLFERTKAAIF